MAAIHNSLGLGERLELLSRDAQYDLSCACGTGSSDTHRHRSESGSWIYPVALPNGAKVPFLRTLMTNVCSSDCAYCPLRAQRDPRRTSLTPEEVVQVFLRYLRAGEVFGLFLTSGMAGTADGSMEKMLQVVRTLRFRERFRGFIHLKILPGCSEEAIAEAVRLASAVSLNIEVPGEKYFEKLSGTKRFLDQIVGSMKLIRDLTAPGSGRERVKQTTQFIVGAAGERDSELLKWMGGLYGRMGLNRIYFSAYQRGLGDPSLPGEQEGTLSPHDLLMREHRLYQADFLLRKYRFSAEEIPTLPDGSLDLIRDPKLAWAEAHPERFPVNLNTASQEELLRVPGIGPEYARRILSLRKERRLQSLDPLSPRKGKLRAAAPFVRFS